MYTDNKIRYRIGILVVKAKIITYASMFNFYNTYDFQLKTPWSRRLNAFSRLSAFHRLK